MAVKRNSGSGRNGNGSSQSEPKTRVKRNSKKGSAEGGKKLTPKQDRFAMEYIIDENGGAAYKRAGYKCATDEAAYVGASKLLRNPNVLRRIEELKKERNKVVRIDGQRVLQEVANIALANIGDYLSWDTEGNVVYVASDQLTREQLAAVKEVSSVEIEMLEAGIKKKTLKLVLHDKGAMLNLAAKHTGLLSDINVAIATFVKYGYTPKLNKDGSYVFVDRFYNSPAVQAQQALPSSNSN